MSRHDGFRSCAVSRARTAFHTSLHVSSGRFSGSGDGVPESGHLDPMAVASCSASEEVEESAVGVDIFSVDYLEGAAASCGIELGRLRCLVCRDA